MYNDPILFVIFLVVFLYSVILHEVAHGWVALRFGDDTAKVMGRLSLNPLVHIDLFGSIIIPAVLYFSTGFAFGYAKPVPVNPSRLRGGAAAYRWVAMGGIITNLILASISALVLRGIQEFTAIEPSNLGYIFFQYGFLLNIVLAVFNALPMPGFDGFNFLTTFPAFARFIAKTPLGNPLIMARYGILISLGIVLLLWPVIGSIITFFLKLFITVFGLTL